MTSQLLKLIEIENNNLSDLEDILNIKNIQYYFPPLSLYGYITNKLSNKMKFAYDFVYINHNMSLNNEKILIAAKFFSKNNNINFGKIFNKITEQLRL